MGDTADRLASQYKVSRGTIKRDAEYAHDINAIAAVADTQGSRIIMETEGKLGHKEVKALADLAQTNPDATKCQLSQVRRWAIGLMKGYTLAVRA